MSLKTYINKFTRLPFIVSLLILSISSCNDKYLDLQPETNMGVGSFFNTEADLNLYANSMYDFPGTGIYTSDAYTLTDNAWSTGNVELKTMMTSIPNSSTITSGWDWSGLRKVNIFLANFNKAQITREKLNHFEGLGRFFRARFYVNKVKRYSDVPWIDVPVGTGDHEILFASRDSREAVVNKIIEDYEFATSNINVSSDRGAVNRWVAKADFARFLLFEGTFRKYHPELKLEGSASAILEKAAAVAKNIMNNGGFTLYKTGNPESDYGKLFYESDLMGNPEIIMARRYAANILNGDTGDGVFGNYETFPLKDLLQAYLMNDGTFYSSQSNYQQKELVDEFRDRDPRLKQTYAYPGWVLTRSGTYAQGAGIYVQQLAKNFSGYHQIKGYYNTTVQDARNGIDVPIYRFAEILLIYGEAKAELGQITQTDLDLSINKLRDRAGMPHLSLTTPIDPVQATKFSNVSDGNTGLILEIRRERRVELALEGYRHDDLMRWAAGKALELEPQGIYFSSLGKKDLTGDGHPDIFLIPGNEAIPNDKESNALGKVLHYYRVGSFGQDVSVFLGGSTAGNIQIIQDNGNFVTPQYYYRPIPQAQEALNPGLTQIFGWK